MLNKLVLYVLLIKDKLLSKAFRRGKDNNDKNLKNSALVRESEILALLYSYGCSLCPFAVICMYCDLVSICSVTKYFQGQGASYILGQFIFRLLECFFISAKIYFLAEFTPLS